MESVYRHYVLNYLWQLLVFFLYAVTAHQRDTSGGDETDLYCSVPWSRMRTSIICFSPNITNRLL